MHTKSIKKICAGLLLALALWLAPTEAEAHRVNLFAYVEGGVVYTESYFSDGQPVVNGQIQVTDGSGHELLAGETDAAGLFEFPLPEGQTLTILLKATMGHRAKFLLPQPEDRK